MWKSAALIGCVLLMNPAYAQQAQAQTGPIKILGCVSPGVQAGCLIIKDRATGKTYQINAASPKPDPAQRLVVTLTGTVTNKVDICQQGPVVENITWSYTKMRCPSGGTDKKPAKGK